MWWDYYIPYMHWPHGPLRMWSRYRPSKAWIRQKSDEENFSLNFAPTGGFLLIGRPVLARRHVDGYFYRGVVKSELQKDGLFLVEFSAQKHGQFKDIEFQETSAPEIVSLDDSLRHCIVTGDHVLAPDINGEAYQPAVVIQGSENRQENG